MRSPITGLATVAAAVAQGAEELAACPMCHTVDSGPTADALAAGGGWRCVRCGQRWDAARLAAVAAYVAWVRDKDDSNRPGVGSARPR
jgi:hypothetical protein